MTMETPLEAEARKRKERLAKLKRKVGTAIDDATEQNAPMDRVESTSGNRDEGDDEDQTQSKKPAAFRSYQPVSEELKKTDTDIQIELKPKAGPEELEEHIAEHLEDTKHTAVVDEVDLTTLAPRKIDWDLKRDISKKLNKLERRTQRAMAELIRERLASGKQDLLISAVNESARTAQAAHMSDDEDD